MKIANVFVGNEHRIAWSTNGAKWFALLPAKTMPWLRSVKSLIKNWHSTSLDQLAKNSEPIEFEAEQINCPFVSPQKVICVGKNFVDHAIEMGGEKPELPVIFNKLPSCLIGPNQPIVLPSISQHVDYEAELVVVIGKRGRMIKRENAMEHVFGYTIGNDVTARDWQKGRPGGQWLLGKTFDTFAPIGPWLVTADSIANPEDFEIELKLNGEKMQIGSTADLIFPIDYLIAHLSQFFTWQPGDLLFTGTPAGVGAGRNPPVFLSDRDVVEISISQIGTLSNIVDGRSG